MAKILTIGSVCKDMFFPTSEGVVLETPRDLVAQKKIMFELGAKYHVEQRYEALGGISVNVAAGLVKLGENVSCYTRIGDDEIGKWIVRELKKIGVNHSMDIIEKDCQSDLSTILIDMKSADRVIFSNQIANQKLVIETEKIGHHDWIFIGDLSGAWQQNIDTVLAFAKKHNMPIVFNPRQKTIHDDVKKIIETVSKCELFFANKDEAIEIISGCDKHVLHELLNEEEYLVKTLHQIGAKVVAITDGARGAWAYDGVAVLHVNALMQQAVDTTGAGDAFTSGFFAAHLKGKNLMTALKWGVANSSSSVTEYGGQKGLLTQVEIESMILKKKI
ncbi:MAG: carbohydrate kinase family protein [Candidatus Moranbacteria bacterium]|nr:carbohydrate kinase family protein [Candidatus Moranbacteria bacterium]